MSAIVWPEELPCGVMLGLSTGVQDGRSRQRMGTGHYKTRVLVSNPPIPCRGSFRFYTWQLERFRRFWREDSPDGLGGGVHPFVIRDQQLDGCKLLDEDGAIMLDESGLPLRNSDWWLVCFGEQLSEDRVAPGRYHLLFNMDIFP